MAAVKKRRHTWTPAKDDLLREFYPDLPTAEIARVLRLEVSQVYDRAARLGIRKSAEYLAGPHACRLRRGDNIGAQYRIQPGHVPWNKGMKGWCAPGCERTQFKPGARFGKAAMLWQPIGAERVTKDGILQRKVSDTGYTPRDYRAVHALVWEAANGPIPPGHIVVFRDGNRRNFAPENLECISRAENMRRNTLYQYPEEIVRAIKTRAVLNRRINRMTKA